MLKYLLLVLSLNLNSCSSVDWDNLFKSKEDTKKRNAKLMKDFEVEEEVLEKFSEKPKEETETTKEVEQKKVPKIQPKKSSTKRVSKKITPAKKSTPTPVVKKKSFKYPEDHPAEYIDMDKNSVKFWHEYKPILFEGEKAAFAVTYGGISTGTITIETKKSSSIGGHDAYHVHARLKTSKYYSYLYEVDDVCDSYIKKENFVPLKFSLIQRQSSQNIDDLQLFDHESLQVYSLYKRVTDDKTKRSKKTKPIPRYFQDPISVLYFVRGLPLEKNKVYSIPFMNKGKAEILTAKLEDVEELDTEIGKKQALKVNISTSHEGKTIKGGHMTFWFSADDDRVFLKFSAKIKIGSIVGSIQKYSK